MPDENVSVWQITSILADLRLLMSFLALCYMYFLIFSMSLHSQQRNRLHCFRLQMCQFKSL